jgi:hypothetical protein
MSVTAAQTRHVPPELFVELAFAIEPPTTVAARFGYSSAEYNALAAQPWFQKALKTKQDELASQGWNFRTKMGMLAEDLLTDAYVAAKASDSAAIKLEVGKYLTKVADLEPRQSQQAIAGPGFSISINLGGQNSTNGVIDVTSQDVSAATYGSLDELPPAPDYGVASFPLTDDLIGVAL